MISASIGYTRDDGDFAILATLNNKDEHMDERVFNNLVEMNRLFFQSILHDESIISLEREDAADYIDLD